MRSLHLGPWLVCSQCPIDVVHFKAFRVQCVALSCSLPSTQSRWCTGWSDLRLASLVSMPIPFLGSCIERGAYSSQLHLPDRSFHVAPCTDRRASLFQIFLQYYSVSANRVTKQTRWMDLIWNILSILLTQLGSCEPLLSSLKCLTQIGVLYQDLFSLHTFCSSESR